MTAEAPTVAYVQTATLQTPDPWHCCAYQKTTNCIMLYVYIYIYIWLLACVACVLYALEYLRASALSFCPAEVPGAAGRQEAPPTPNSFSSDSN